MLEKQAPLEPQRPLHPWVCKTEDDESTLMEGTPALSTPKDSAMANQPHQPVQECPPGSELHHVHAMMQNARRATTDEGEEGEGPKE